MGKTGKWLKSFLTGKRLDKDRSKEKYCDNSSSSSTPVPKEKRRWSFRRPTETRKEHNQPLASTSAHGFLETGIDPERHAVAVAVATAAAADAAVAAAQAAAAMIRLTSGGSNGKNGTNGRRALTQRRNNSVIEEVAAIKIQSVFRSYLARKALCALKGLVKLQALVRGHLVRKQASTTLRCMQALVAVQTRARLQRLKMLEEEEEEEERSKCRTPQRQRSLRNSPQHARFRHSNDNSTEENVKIVEVDTSVSKARHSYSTTASHPERPLSSHSRGGAHHTSNFPKVLQTPSALTDMSPRTYSGRFDEFSFTTAQSGGCSPYFKSGSCASDATKSPYGTSQDYPLFPNYMANTESSRAKARSQSAPKSRPAESIERQPSRRRASLEGRNIPRGIKMQRSASQVGPTISGYQYQYQYPWSVKLDRSNVSVKDSECGSSSTVMTDASYYSSLLAQEVHGRR